LQGKYTDEQIAIGTVARLVLEEHLFWGVRRWLFIVDGGEQVRKEAIAPLWQKWLFTFMYGRKIKKDTWSQGLSCHSEEEINMLMERDIDALGHMLGNKKFFLGDEPSEVDAAVFGFVVLLISDTLKNSPFRKMAEKFPNFEPYCRRMKERFWSDWDQCLG